MFRTSLAAIATTLSVAATPVAAATVADVFSSFWVFGDSLSDNGNVSAALAPAGIDFPPPPYFQGRFSDGPVWNERFLADFGPGQARNFAFGGAQSGTNADTIPDLPAQLAAFSEAQPLLSPGDRPLASVYFGANDMFSAIGAAAFAAPGAVPGILQTAVVDTLTNITAGIGVLNGLGIEDFALFNLPDLGSTPRLRDLGPAAQGLGSVASGLYNSGFDDMVAALRADGLNIYTVDVFALFVDATMNPAAYGLTNLADACLPVDPFDILDPVNPAPVPPPAPIRADTSTGISCTRRGSGTTRSRRPSTPPFPRSRFPRPPCCSSPRSVGSGSPPAAAERDLRAGTPRPAVRFATGTPRLHGLSRRGTRLSPGNHMSFDKHGPLEANWRDAISTVEEIIEDARQGRVFILVDHEDRENEGDLVIPAQMATPEVINFMATHGRGLICLALPGERIDALGLPLMAANNSSRHETAFTVSIEAREGVSTGISAHDRARTVAVAIDPAKTAADIASPGHVFPLRARSGGVLVRAGHTEAAVDISRLAGLNPSGVICEVMNDDGTMARLPDLVAFAQKHGIRIGAISDLIAYRRRNDNLVRVREEKAVTSAFGGTGPCASTPTRRRARSTSR
jgi:3,4-dihydroxy-2-butanone 4-phosphate synthase